MFWDNLPPRIYESLKTLCCLANARGPLQAQEIAAATGLPRAQTAKILQSMTWAGFLESRRGAKGGFWLVIPATRIRVTDVTGFFAHHSPANLAHSADAVVRALAPATARCQEELRRITIDDIAKLDTTGPTRRTPGGIRSPAKTRKDKKAISLEKRYANHRPGVC